MPTTACFPNPFTLATNLTGPVGSNNSSAGVTAATDPLKGWAVNASLTLLVNMSVRVAPSDGRSQDKGCGHHVTLRT